MDRVRFLTHQGKQILLIDYSGCTRQTLLDILKERERIVLAQPPGSVLTLVDVTGVETSKEVFDEVKKVAVRERAKVKRAAVVGIESVPKVLFESLKTFAAREYRTFATREEAMDWLVKEDDEGALAPPAD